MPQVEISVSDQLESEIDQLVEQGEFMSRERAIEGLLARGLSTYEDPDAEPDEADDTLFTQAVDDQRDPAMRDDQPPDEQPF